MASLIMNPLAGTEIAKSEQKQQEWPSLVLSLFPLNFWIHCHSVGQPPQHLSSAEFLPTPRLKGVSV